MLRPFHGAAITERDAEEERTSDHRKLCGNVQGAEIGKSGKEDLVKTWCDSSCDVGDPYVSSQHLRSVILHGLGPLIAFPSFCP